MGARAAALAPAAALLALVLACGDGESPEATATAVTDGPFAGVEVAATIQLAMRDIAFDRATIDVAAGELVAIELRNRGVLAHDFTIDAIAAEVSDVGLRRRERHDVHVPLGRGEAATLLMRVSERDEYVFYCSVPGHRKAGMEGTLVVR